MGKLKQFYRFLKYFMLQDLYGDKIFPNRPYKDFKDKS